jgi:nitrite reductase (cytochrome c-552)
MKAILQLIRKAQWRWDFVAASHGGSFHAPLESSRILADGIYLAQEARLRINKLLAKKGITEEIPMPDISSKAKAQAYIGLDIPTLKAEKKVFIDKTIPEWLSKAKERESKYPVKTL